MRARSLACVTAAATALLLIQYLARPTPHVTIVSAGPTDPLLQGPPDQLPPPWLHLPNPRDSEQALQILRLKATPRHVIVNAKNGLGNRLRALASAMAVAAKVGRPVLLIWVPDLHCNCSFTSLYKRPLPFALLEEELPMEQITHVYGHSFHVYNYMRPEPGAIKDEKVVVDTQRHVYFKSAFLMNHSRGDWPHAYRFLRQLEPVDRVRKMLVADRSMVGLHVRNIFDAPRARHPPIVRSATRRLTAQRRVRQGRRGCIAQMAASVALDQLYRSDGGGDEGPSGARQAAQVLPRSRLGGGVCGPLTALQRLARRHSPRVRRRRALRLSRLHEPHLLAR